MAWKNYSRKCVYCGGAGPRMDVAGGYAHKRCLPDSVLREMRKAAYIEGKRQALLPGGRKYKAPAVGVSVPDASASDEADKP